MTYTAATQPTFYFIGVTTGKSSIMKVFPAWARHLGLRDVVIKGIDLPLHADPSAYREVVTFIKTDPLSVGALVTTHKIDLFKACRDLFDVIDAYASGMHETSCISKHDRKLFCHAKDPISSGLAIEAFLPKEHFARTGAEVFCIGAGGSTIAITWFLMQAQGADRPSRIVVSDRDQGRLEEIRRIHCEAASHLPIEFVLADFSAVNDAITSNLKPGSVVINATGLGKDRPGSPLTGQAVFPDHGIVWDLNYRGNLVFLDQAREQQASRSLQVENGWVYFIHGWTQVIGEVFNMGIPTSGPAFDEISRIAAEAGKSG